ncbi:hypothetical protein FGX01_02055, partial [Xylella fastidiosa subsp. multiplex]|nr:hypothetical protein [Xylella fastidiosa subsp. multiplex]
AFFWANRLVPADLPGRQLWEVRAFFAAWGLSLVYAFLFQKNAATAMNSPAMVPALRPSTRRSEKASRAPGRAFWRRLAIH